MEHGDYLKMIDRESGALAGALRAGDVAAPVPSCPGWNIGRLAKHTGITHRWADAIVDRRSTEPVDAKSIDLGLSDDVQRDAPREQTTEQAENLMFLHLPGRLAKALLRLSDGEGEARERNVVVTQKDLGNIIGMSRESTNRQLRIWEQHKWVRLGRGGIVILSAKALERVAESDSEGG